MCDDLVNWLRLSHASVSTSVDFIPLIQAYDGATGFLSALYTDKKLQTALPERLVSTLLHTDMARVEADLVWLEQQGNNLIKYTDESYPNQLREITHAPLSLFVQGDSKLLKETQIAIVGSRKPSKYGKDMASWMAKQLTDYNIVITSGMAAGIDSFAHKAALYAGNTVAVLGHGFNYLYPAANKLLARQIVEQGVLITEFPVSYQPIPANFPRRNRIISGLSRGVLVVEAAIKSGSLITAKYAMEHGREVFALPGSINNPLATGCHKLIQQGAKLVQDIADITLELGIQPTSKMSTLNGRESHNNQNTLDESQKVLLDNIGCDPISVDELYLLTEINIDVLTGKLLKLELSGYISAVSAGVYIRNYK